MSHAFRTVTRFTVRLQIIGTLGIAIMLTLSDQF